MQEFRPADVIEQDTQLAESLIDGDVDALAALVDRYGRAVNAVTVDAADASGGDPSIEVFARAWIEREGLEPVVDFTTWLGGLSASVAERTVDRVSDGWAIAMAIDAVDSGMRPVLRAHHLGDERLPDEAHRHERRLRSRLSHLGDEAVVTRALADPRPWVDPNDDTMERVRSRLGLEGPPVGADVESGQASDDDPADSGGRPSFVARSLRPVLLGLGGAVVVLFVAIVALSAASGSPDPVAFSAELIPTGAIVDVEGGELTVTERASGLQLDLEAPTLPRRAGDQFYEAVLVLRDGTELGIGSFNEGFDVSLFAGVALDRVEEFVVVARSLESEDADVILKLDVPAT